MSVATKRLCRVAAALVCVMLFFGCTKPAAIEETPAPTSTETAAGDVLSRRLNVSDALLGFIVPPTENYALSSAKHGFLRTAENLGYPSKLYMAAAGQESVAAVEQAITDGCKALLIWDENNANAEALKKAGEQGIYAVVPYYRASGEGMSSNVVADVLGYTEEVAMGVAERMVERECKAGKILVYGKNPVSAYEGFTEAIASYYPQYNVAYFTRTEQDGKAAIDELAAHILWNRDIKGMFCTDTDGASIARRATVQAESTFKKDGAPEAPPKQEGVSVSPSPQASVSPTPGSSGPLTTPVPEGLKKTILISIAGYGISDENISMLKKNDIYAFVLEPYYEASAQSVMLLDRLLSGQSVPAEMKLNMPIVRVASLDKYRLLYEQVQEWFLLKSPEPTSAISPSPAPTT